MVDEAENQLIPATRGFLVSLHVLLFFCLWLHIQHGQWYLFTQVNLDDLKKIKQINKPQTI